jgi:hypothetical protein
VLLVWTNLSSARRAAGETLASRGGPVARLLVVVLALDFCVLERAGTRATLDDAAELDDKEQYRLGLSDSCDAGAHPSVGHALDLADRQRSGKGYGVRRFRVVTRLVGVHDFRGSYDRASR